MSDQPTATETPTETEPARPKLDGVLADCDRYPELWGIVMSRPFVRSLIAYVFRLESELAAKSADVNALLAANIEETARADNAEAMLADFVAAHREQRERADRAERQLNALVDAVCVAVERADSKESLANAPALPAVAFQGSIAANLSPGTETEATEGESV